MIYAQKKCLSTEKGPNTELPRIAILSHMELQLFGNQVGGGGGGKTGNVSGPPAVTLLCEAISAPFGGR